MAHLYIYSPSSAVRDRARFRRALARLKALGHEVEVDSGALAAYQRFAGDDEARLAAIARAAASGADAALISRGGYGLTRLLPRLPYDALARAAEGGLRWVGMSDFTALQCALLTKTGATTWAGPALGDDFGGPDEPDDIMLACFDDLLQGVGEGAGWRLPLPRGSSKVIAARGQPVGHGGDFQTKPGLLWGGNLAVLSSLVGTPYLPNPKGGILFLEDVGEHPYRVERMLTQLLHAGVLARQQALLLGQFTGFKPIAGYDRGFGMASVAERLRALLPGVPVLAGLPFGHVPTKVCLPVGARVTLAVEGRDALIYWG